jgi:Na+/H+ antiporter NhaD/arsenite permease-like protein
VVNTLFLLVGSVLANLIGTTGASMLLIRPLIRANQARQRKVHIIIIFIFLVSNGGGLLTPLGDPPLFLGFLKGVDFAWTLTLWPQWLMAVGALLLVFNLVEHYQFSKEPSEARAAIMGQEAPPADRFGIEGSHNFLFLAMIVGLILISGYVVYPLDGSPVLQEHPGAVISKAVQMVGMVLIALASYQVTHRAIRHQNGFSFGPIIEVAALFAGIFMAMIPALLILETQGAKLGVDRPWQYFWMTGALSGFLDNAPTYLAFTSLAKGALHLPEEGLRELMLDPTGAVFLTAISSGAVFMGANTYIGNGPNFMVKAIAEEARIKMPSFFGYMAWSVAILIPLFIVMTFILF